MKKYLAEYLGTFALTSAVITALMGNWSAYTPMIAGLTLGLFVYTLGAISGAHFNPAITIGIWSIKKIPTRTALCYIGMQLLGAITARWFTMIISSVPDLAVSTSGYVFIGEMLGAGVLAFGVAAVVYNRVTQSASGLTIGGSLLLGIICAVGLSANGVLNPAVAIGIGSFSWVYALAPIVGSVIAFQLYRVVEK